MNQLKRNFYFVIESYIGMWREHRAHRKTIKQIRKHDRELSMRRLEANKLHKTTGKTYWVLPDYNGVLQVLDKQNIKNLKRAKIMNRQVTVVDLLMEAEYCTATNYFVVLFESYTNGTTFNEWEYFKGTVDECIDKYSKPEYICPRCTIIVGHERVATIKNGAVIKH